MQLPPNASPPALSRVLAPFVASVPPPSSRCHRPLARGRWCFWGSIAEGQPPLLVVVASIALGPQLENGAARFVHQWRWSLVTLWFTALILMILVRFWNYWSTLL